MADTYMYVHLGRRRREQGGMLFCIMAKNRTGISAIFSLRSLLLLPLACSAVWLSLRSFATHRAFFGLMVGIGRWAVVVWAGMGLGDSRWPHAFSVFRIVRKINW